MRRILFLLIFTTTLLVSCNTTIISLSEIDVIPSDVKDKIISDYTLQLISDREDTAYIVYKSNGIVSTDLISEGDTLKIKIDKKNIQSDVIVQHVFKLTLDREYEVINVFINGKSTPFDNISTFIH